MKLGYLCVIGAICATNVCKAWNSVADFECDSTNALDHVSILVSEEFRAALTNYVATPLDHESQVAAQIVLGESFLANYNETMDEQNLTEAMSIATNICALTHSETNSWYCWQSKLLVFACLAQSDDMLSAYNVASNALASMGPMNVTTSNRVSAALLKRNQAEGLSIRQSVVLSKALSAAMLQKCSEATNLVLTLPPIYHEMVNIIINNN